MSLRGSLRSSESLAYARTSSYYREARTAEFSRGEKEWGWSCVDSQRRTRKEAGVCPTKKQTSAGVLRFGTRPMVIALVQGDFPPGVALLLGELA